MLLSEKQQVFTHNIVRLINFAEHEGFHAQLKEVTRTEYQQTEYLRTGKSKTANSQHLKSLAADIYFSPKDKDVSFYFTRPSLEVKDILAPIGLYWESLHVDNTWGGNWQTHVDCPHFEMRG